MLGKIEEKNKALQEKDVVIQELIGLMTKFKSQISNQDELMKLLSTYNNTSIRHWILLLLWTARDFSTLSFFYA